MSDDALVDGMYDLSALLCGARALARDVHRRHEPLIHDSEPDAEDVARILDAAIRRLHELSEVADGQRAELAAMRAEAMAKPGAEVFDLFKSNG